MQEGRSMHAAPMRFWEHQIRSEPSSLQARLLCSSNDGIVGISDPKRAQLTAGTPPLQLSTRLAI